jgi:hypothetical protein
LLAVALVIALACVLAACGGEGESTTTVTASQAAATTPIDATAPEGTSPTTTTPTTAPEPIPAPATSIDSVLSRPFSASSPWNTQVADQPVDPRSREMMRLARLRVATVEQPDGTIEQQSRPIDVGLTVNVTRWTVPVFSDAQEGAEDRLTICRQLDCGPDATTTIKIPPDACPDPRFDGWMTALDTEERVAYDFWRARCEADGSLSYHYVKRWDLDGPGYQDPTGVSARGSGLPLFAGLITPQEIEGGRIEHALAISIPGAAQRRYVQPASRTDGTGELDSVPEGARLRLRPGAAKLLTDKFVRNGAERGAALTIIDALEKYGAIVVDRSAAPTMYAQRNADWVDLLPLNLLQDIPLTRFDVVDLDRVYLDPPRGGEDAALPEDAPASVPGGGSGTESATDTGNSLPPTATP